MSISYEDAAGREVTRVPRHLNGDFDVTVGPAGMSPSGSFPLLLGAFDDFWARCLSDYHAGRLTVLKDGVHICLTPSIPFPPGAKVILMLALDDWSIITSSRAPMS